MPSALRYFRSKRKFLKWAIERGVSEREANRKWTGPGYYYTRYVDGKKTVSKHVPHLDRVRGGRIGRGKWRHVTDLVYGLVKHAKSVAKVKVKKIKKKAAAKAREALSRREKRALTAVAKAPAKEIATAVVKRVAKKVKRKVSKATLKLAEKLWRNIPKKYKTGDDRIWTYVSVIALASVINKQCKEKGIDPASVDWVQEIDWSQGYSEAKRLVEKIVGREFDRYTEEEIAGILSMSGRDLPKLSESEIDWLIRSYEDFLL